MKNKTLVIGSIIIIVLVISIGLVLGNNNSSTSVVGTLNSSEKTDILKENIEEDITISEDKKNMYLFWGDGCSHCEELSIYLNEIKDNYSKHYNLYTLETWHNEENNLLKNKFATAMEEDVEGVPYLIIGSKSFSGYSTDMNEKILKAIKSEYKKDNYFDAYQNIENEEE